MPLIGKNEEQQQPQPLTPNNTSPVNQVGHISVPVPDLNLIDSGTHAVPATSNAPAVPIKLPVPRNQEYQQDYQLGLSSSSGSANSSPKRYKASPSNDKKISVLRSPQLLKEIETKPKTGQVALKLQKPFPCRTSKPSKFNKPGVYRRVLERSDPLFREDRSISPRPLKQAHVQEIHKSELATEAPSAASFFNVSHGSLFDITRITSVSSANATIESRDTIRINLDTSSQAGRDDRFEVKVPQDKEDKFPVKPIPDYQDQLEQGTQEGNQGKGKSTSESNESTSWTPQLQGLEDQPNALLPLIGQESFLAKEIDDLNIPNTLISKSVKISKKISGKKLAKRSKNMESDAESSENPEKEILVIHPHTSKLDLQRKSGQEQLAEENPSQEQLDAILEEIQRTKRAHARVTLSEGQVRKNRFDGMISKMKEWKKPPAKTKAALISQKTETKGSKKKLRFGSGKVHPATSIEISTAEKRSTADIVKLEHDDVKVDIDVNELQSSKAKSKGKKGVRGAGMRVRGHNPRISFKFTEVLNTDIDPLRDEVITKETDINQWMRKARRSLPSAVGIPIEHLNNVLGGGLPAVESARRKSLNVQGTYNTLFDEMQKQHSKVSVISGIVSVSSILDSKLHVSPSVVIEQPTVTKKVAALKFLADHLSEKRKHKQDYILQGLTRHALQDEESSFKERIGFYTIKTHRLIHDMVRECTIWKKDIYEIHGRYGLSAAAYFRWMRTVLIMNIFYFFFTFVLVLLPELMTIGTPTPISTCFIQPDPLCPNNAPQPVIPKRNPFSFEDLLIGAGYFENSYLYYSGYRDTQADPSCPWNRSSVQSNERSTVFSLTGFRLSMVALLIFLMNSFYISIQITNFYHVARLESRVPGLTKKDHFKAVLCAWDFNCSDEFAAKALHSSIWYELKELAVGLENLNFKIVVKATKGECFTILSQRFGNRAAQLILHWIANIGVLIACIFAGGMVYFSYYARILYMRQAGTCALERAPNWILALPAIFISFTTYLMSKVCVKISNYEHWDSIENQNWAVIGRVGLYYLTELFVLYGYWLYHSKALQEQICYEELFGQELYRIIVFQGIVQAGSTVLYNTIYSFYKKRKDPNYEKPVFDSASLTLSLFFMHTLAGFGFFFCPLISVLVIGRLIVTFYHRKYTLLHFSSFPTHLSHNSEIAAPYLVVFFVTYLITSILNVFLLAELHPSSVCGPFSHFRESGTHTGSENGHYYDIFVEGFTSKASGILIILVKPGIAVVIIILLACLCYAFGVWAKAYVLTMEKMHNLLLLERDDRDFLLKTIFKIIKKQASLSGPIHEDEVEEVGSDDQLDRKLSQKSNDWSNLAMTLGIYNNRRGSMAKAPTFENTVDKPEDYKDSNRKSQDLSSIKDVLLEAVAPRRHHHATIRRDSIDNWLQEFLQSKRVNRRSGIAVDNYDREELAKRFGTQVREHEGSDEDKDEDEIKEFDQEGSANPRRESDG